MNLTSIDKELLAQVADLHSIPQGAINIRKNGQGILRNTTADIEIIPKTDKSGIDVIVHAGVVNKSVHIPVIITEGGVDDLVYNDFYIGENCDVLIVAGCGIHNNSNSKSTHNGIHTFHLEKNCKVRYVEKHLGLGSGAEKILNPVTEAYMKSGSNFEMETVQLGGVSSSVRTTRATLDDDAHLVVKEKIKTDNNQSAKTKFMVNLKGDKSSCNIVSRSVASDNSYQQFDSKLVGNAKCFGHVECDGLLAGNARIVSIPQIDAKNSNAELIHEAQIGKIADEQLTKLMTLGLNQKQAEDLIIKAYLR